MRHQRDWHRAKYLRGEGKASPPVSERKARGEVVGVGCMSLRSTASSLEFKWDDSSDDNWFLYARKSVEKRISLSLSAFSTAGSGWRRMPCELPSLLRSRSLDLLLSFLTSFGLLGEEEERRGGAVPFSPTVTEEASREEARCV